MSIIVFLLLIVSLPGTEPITCYSCSNVSSVSQCTQLTTCASPGEICHQEYNVTTSGKSFKLGCVDPKLCPPSSTISPGNVIGREASHDTCSECCQTDNCNRQLCQHQDPSCVDHGDFDCAFIGATINYCDEPLRAVNYCRNFCGLCNLKNGAWSAWGAWSDCSMTCGPGTQSRARQCDNPVPTNGGDDCAGNSSETQTCTLKACPVHGGWTTWSDWGTCSVSCDVGMRRRDRSCSQPYPSPNGDFCQGDSRDDAICVMPGCTDGGWSAWSPWSTCSHSCGDGMASRSRTCDSPLPSITGRSCLGDPVQTHSCKIKNCQVKVSAFTTTAPAGSSSSLRFTKVVFNEGGNYNSSSGNFVCTIPGVYFFTLSLVKIRSSDDSINDHVSGYIRQNGVNKVTAYIDPNDQYADIGSYGVTGSVTLRLSKGDIVDVDGYFKLMDSNSMFSGFLVQPDEQ